MKSIVLNLDGDEESFALNDRGLAYGDGVFETILIHAGEPVWWNQHWLRFIDGAKRLKITAPDESVVRNACKKLLEGHKNNVLKIILTRGSGGRGYKIPDKQHPRIIISIHPAPDAIQEGVALHWCETRLARQPLLAGIKHLNRLEQVLARSEWNDENIFDGVMRDTEDNIVCTTSANVFAKIGGQWFSPIIDQAGIAGIAREWVFKQWPQTQEARLSRSRFERAEAIFICNAVRGILGVNRLGEKSFPVHQGVVDLQSQLAIELPAFARGEKSGA
ncbi:MAG: aminodeoxychorismate lyase [Arenimonas sp.]